MNGICKQCGTVGKITDFLARNEDVRAMAMIAELPVPVSALALDYLALFQPVSGRAMAANKTQRLIAELKELVDRKLVQKPGAVPRPCLPKIWAEAIEQMLAQQASLALPMKSHNYLRSIAWSKADQVDARNEAASEADKRHPQHRPHGLVVKSGGQAQGRDPLAGLKKDWEKNHADQG